jgi:hypothetical protein
MFRICSWEWILGLFWNVISVSLVENSAYGTFGQIFAGGGNGKCILPGFTFAHQKVDEQDHPDIAVNHFAAVRG